MKLRYQLMIVVLALLYLVVINIEQGSNSYRFTVTVVDKQDPDNVQILDCLPLLEGITQEMIYQKSAGIDQVRREKMNIFSKWFKCGIL